LEGFGFEVLFAPELVKISNVPHRVERQQHRL